MQCDLCDGIGGEPLFQNARLRVVAVTGAEAAYTGFCRVIWNNHVKEMTELSRDDRNAFMDAVYRVETALIASLKPDKVNLASLGNMTPHLHWHVIPRFHDDQAFPKPIWAHSLDSTSAASIVTLRDQTAWKEAVRFALSR
jgi:diadenosine tetraphosphate (Ap4A) HIT family hydrolase